MFYYIEGTVTYRESGLAVIDAGGVGYACNTSLNTLSQLETGQSVRLYTYLHVREDIFDLYGFIDSEELNFFKMLISVSGIGPKVAMSMLSTAPASQLAAYIISGDEKMLTQAPGIGKKTAQRIILELKDKIKKEQIGLGSEPGFVPLDASFGSNLSEASVALGVLGYTAQEVGAALRGIDSSGLSVEEIVRLALKNMAGGK